MTEEEDNDWKAQAEEILESENDDQELKEFDKLSNNHKVEKLNNLIKKSQIYSQIIADKILAKSQPKPQEPTKNGSGPVKKKQKTGNVLDMLTKKQKTNQPKIITGTMKPYQLEGLNWLIKLYENGLNGILADEMGLGKTIQCIAFIAFLIEQGITGPYLVVGPLSTITNWYNEFEKFAPSLKVLKYIGPKDDRKNLEFAGYNIVLTSYELSIKDFTKLSKTNWKFLIIDEGHRLKNIDCLLIKILKKLDVNNRLLITGTPLQNNLNELWSLLNFILPDIFHDLKLFQQWFNFDEIDNLQGIEDEAVNRFIEKTFKKKLIESLHTIIMPFMLRRLKVDVLKLPPKKEYLIQVDLTNYQKKLYLDALDSRLYEGIKELYVKEYSENNLKATTKRKYSSQLNKSIDSELKHLKLQNLLIQLRTICNSPYIYYEPFPVNHKLTNFDKPPPDQEARFIESLIDNSIKFRVLDQLIGSIKGKVLIFSQFTRTLDLLSDYFIYKDIKTSRFDGSTAQSDRDIEIHNFKNDPKVKVFLLSTRSGGLGINLVEATNVILFDNDWNPQMDIQAIDRCHRIGQTKPVKIFRFVIRDSIEELLIIKNYSKRFLERLVIRLGSKFDDMDLETEFSNLVNVSKSFGLTVKDFEFNGESGGGSELEPTEIQELVNMDVDTFSNKGPWDNISVFESIRKMDDLKS